MDVNKVTNVDKTQPTAAPDKVEKTDETFKFTLASKIDDADFREKVDSMMKEIDEQGKKIAEHMDIRDMKDEKDHMSILGHVDEIRGLLIDIST